MKKKFVFQPNIKDLRRIEDICQAFLEIVNICDEPTMLNIDKVEEHYGSILQVIENFKQKWG